MATEIITAEYSGALNVYHVIENEADGNVFDWNDSTFKSYGTATTPTQAMAASGLANTYRDSINLATIHNAGDLKKLNVMIFEELVAATPDATTDFRLGIAPLVIQFGNNGQREVNVGFGATIEGADIAVQAWLEIDGVIADLDTIDASATCDITLREQTAGAVLFQVDDADDAAFALSANVANHFEMSKTSVITSSHDDKNFFARVTIVENSNSWAADFPCGIFGGS
jgi:hypothetical protein